MCGITGIVAKGPVNVDAVSAMTERVAHRGPDGEGIWANADGHVVLGHRRLAIIDPTSAGAQPMCDATGTTVLTFNGEIYNYVEIMARLRAEGATFRSSCDTEVLLEAYRTWGESCLDELNGMFSFALYDSTNGNLFCARDRFGEKPFLFLETPEFFAFASEYKSLFALTEISPEIEEMRLLRFLHQPRQGLDDGRETVFRGICQLLPGEKLSLDTHSLKVTISRYWEVMPDSELARLSEADAAARFRDLLTDSTRIRMRSDVEVGSCLSGGLDSSAIICLARDIIGDDKPYHVFTGRFPETASDEWEFAKEIIDHARVTSHVVTPTGEGLRDEIAEFCWFNELPTGSTSQYAQWCVFRLAKEQGVTVLLDGQGADELLGGYEQYFADYLKSLVDAGHADRVAAEADAIKARYPLALENTIDSWKTRLPTAVRWRMAQWSGQGSNILFGLAPDLASRIAAANQEAVDERFHALTAALNNDSFHKHLPTLLRYGDRNSMAHSREVRLPFCDHRLAEFTLSQPPENLMGAAETKHLLRVAFDGVLPEKIRTRWNKQGFLPPQSEWFRNGLGDWAKEIINGRPFVERGYWRADWWWKVMQRMDAGEDHLAWTIWKPLIAEAWREHFVNRIATQPTVRVFS